MAKKTSSIMDDIQQYIGKVQPIPIVSSAAMAATAAAAPVQNHDKISMDMKILQNRIDSVSIIQYYRDLKNERIRTGNTQAIYMQDESKLKDDIDRMMDAKPWVRLDSFTKRKKITQFIETLVSTGIIPIETKKSITDKVLDPKRAQEQKVFDLLEDTEYVEGDKVFVHFKNDSTLGLRENFDGDYSKPHLFKKLYNTAQVFDSVLCTEDLFINYSLKRSQKLLGAFNEVS